MSLDSRSDLQLIEAYLANDEESFAYLVERYLPSIYRFLARLLGDTQLAEDASQETFLKAWKHLHSFDQNRSFKTWLFSIARNTAIDQLRKQRTPTFSDIEANVSGDPEEYAIDPTPLPSALLERKELATLLEQGLATLPPTTRTIILLHETEEMTFQEIAEILQEPMNTVKSRYRRALHQLRTFLTERL